MAPLINGKNEMIHIQECSSEDIPILAMMNKQLIEDEKAENVMTISELEKRMREFLRSNYKAYYFKENLNTIGYALCNISKDPIYLRQYFIKQEYRNKGYGKESFKNLLLYLNKTEIEIDVYSWNENGIKFWESLGFVHKYIHMNYKEE
ncbi:GNAT family N-acetyltransferase [Breznakiella homolactica]|uniref:GNAT family N-acetyltransferase n=1 Tax=Breznakiella homolactica TaxID=2798577 RepID=A0A7T7XPZ2_9SPIR|nr:GNAT family N-acetyltransferase [Breznakiella homolactica]QQO10365.1 GNAT family N-acetyltransferase [Breznakiella homolactica]